MSYPGSGTRLLLLFLIVCAIKCTTQPTCVVSPPGSGLVFRAVRASGGVASVTANVVVDSAGHVMYSTGRPRCAKLTTEELTTIQTHLSSPSMTAGLDAARKKNYKAVYHNSAHLLLATDQASVFVPMYVALEEPMLPVLEVIDRILRKKFGHAYQYHWYPFPGNAMSTCGCRACNLARY